jgi:hypothetical protein
MRRYTDLRGKGQIPEPFDPKGGFCAAKEHRLPSDHGLDEAIGDARVVLAGGIQVAPRIARHGRVKIA